MQRLTGSFHRDRKPSRVELPERSSTYFTAEQQKGPVSPESTRISSPGLESLRDIADRDAEYPIVDPPEKELCTPSHSAPEVDERHLQNAHKRKKKYLFWIIALAASIAVGLAVGLGVGLTRNKG